MNLVTINNKLIMDLDRISLSSKDNYWLYILNEHNVNEFTRYDKPYFTLPDEIWPINENIKLGDIIIFISTNKHCSNFVGCVQLNSKVILNKNGKIKIFKDAQLNSNYVLLKFRLLCNDPVKLNTVLKHLNTKDEGFTTVAKFTHNYIKKHIIICPFPSNNGKLIIKYLIQLNNESNNDDSEEAKPTKIFTKQTKKKIGLNKTTTESSNSSKKNVKKVKNVKKRQSSSDSDSYELTGSETNSRTNSEEEEQEEEKGLIPIMIIPCQDFNIDPSKNKIKYFTDHYKSCIDCVITNNNDIELGSVINNCSLEFHEITEERNSLFNPALDQYFSGNKYEPIESLEHPFVRILYINNDHDIYDKCIMICWII